MSIWAEWRSLPNLLSFLRLALIPVFFVLLLSGYYFFSVVVVAVAGLTDYLDGYFARRLGLVTRLGQLLDPVADRLYIFFILLGLSITAFIPWWLFFVIISRDLLFLFGYVYLANRGFGPLPVHFLGKAGTFALLYSFPLLLIASAFPFVSLYVLPVAWAFALWGVGLYWWSGFIYLRQVFLLISKRA